MAEVSKGSTRSPGGDFGLFILFLIILGIIWFAQGGPENPPSGSFWQNRMETFDDSGTFVGNNGGSFEDSDSVAESKVTIHAGKATETDPDEEYIEVRALKSNEDIVNITNWTVEGAVGLNLKIPQAVHLMISSRINPKSDVILNPGEKAIIVTGRSPIGTSFRLNKCTGYFEQFQDFYPSLPQKCLYPKDEEWPTSLSYDCLDYIDTLPRCKANLTHPFSLQDNDCIQAINNILSYNGCVDVHKNDEDFYEPEWRIYLNRDDELWKDRRETITLRDRDGNVAGSVSYSY